MHDIKWIRETPEGLDRALARRNMPAEERAALLGRIRTLDETRRETLTKLEGLLARRNAASKEVGQAKAAKDEARAAALMEEVGASRWRCRRWSRPPRPPRWSWTRCSPPSPTRRWTWCPMARTSTIMLK